MNLAAIVFRFFLLVCIFGALVSCQQEPEPDSLSITELVSTSTIEPTQQPPTAAISTTAAEMLTATPEPTKTPTVEATPMPVGSPKTEPTPTPTMEATALPVGSPTTESPDIRDEFFDLSAAAESAYQAGDYVQALQFNNQMVELANSMEVGPWMLEAYLFRGDTYDKLKNYEAAIVDYESANVLEEGKPEILNNLCWWFGLTEQPEEALPYCEEAVTLNPTASHLDSRGLAYGLLGEYDSAIADFEIVLSDLENTTDPVLAAVAAQRADWIALMKVGENPFTPQEMARLRGEVIVSDSDEQDSIVAGSKAVDALMTPVPTASPIPTSTTAVISMEADGSGDYETLSEAVKDAPAGATIILGPGTFRQEETLEINKAIHLVGARMGQSEVVSGAAAPVLSFDDAGPFISEDITYRHEGNEGADVVVVFGGEIAFVRNRFTGGVRGPDGGGVGLVLLNTTGFVRESAAADNEFAGIALMTDDPNLETYLTRNILNDNTAGVGILFAGDASGTALENACSRNGQGILLIDRAKPTLEGNVCQENEGNGIAYAGDSGGVARGNDLSGNYFGGIEVNEQAQPLLEENSLRDNGGSGILYLNNSGGTARRNDCFMNGQNGIDLGDNAQPALEENICIGNAFDGIGYYAQSGGTALANECSKNGRNGISVREDARPTLVNNVCNGNGAAGISYMENTSGSATKNICSENMVGFWVDEESHPTLEENICENNEDAGIYYWLNATGLARMNEISGNGLCIYVPETADPKLVDNNCHDNIEGEIKDERK